jgi:hypothetical protein
MVHVGSTAEQPVLTEVQSKHMQELIRKVKICVVYFRQKFVVFSSNTYITVKIRTGLCQYMHLECNQLCGCSILYMYKTICLSLLAHIFIYVQYIYVYIYVHLVPTCMYV